MTIVLSSLALLPVQQATAQTAQQYRLTNLANTFHSTKVNTMFGETLAVRVQQLTIAGNPYVDGVEVTFTATTSEGGASGTFATTGTNTVTVVSTTIPYYSEGNPNPTNQPGWAIAPAFTANGTAGSYSVVVKAKEPTPQFAQPYTFTMTNTAETSNKAFLISTGDGSLQAALLNTTYTSPFFANVFNGNNQHLPGITVTFTAPASGASGVFTSTGTNVATAVTDANGVAVAPSFRANGIAGGYFVEASISGNQTQSGEELSTTFSVRNSSTEVLGVPETVSASAGSGQQVSVATQVPTNLQVAVFDGSLAHVPGATVTFTLPSTGASGLFSNNSRTFTTTTDDQGLATALPLTTNTIVGQIQVEVTATKNNVTRTLNMSVFNGKVLTTTTVSLSPANGSVYGQPVVVSATVRATEGAYIPTGPVNFKQGGSLLNSCKGVMPSNGVATCTLNWLEPGTYSFSADYLGDEVSETSSSQSVSHTVTKASTSIEIGTSHPTFALEGETITFTATVKPVAPGAAQPGEPTGQISFTASDGTLINGGDPVPLVNGVATISTSDLKAGYVTITTVYNGDNHFFGSSNSYVQHVYTIPEVTQDPSDTLKLVGETVTLTAAATGFPTPTVQWQVSTDGGESFSDIQAATSTTYSFTAAPKDDQTQYRAVFTNPAGSDTSTAATLTVRQPPSFTSASTTTFTVGEAGSFTVTADGILPPAISQTGGTLPDGVTFDAETGLLSGTPLDGSGGEYALTFVAANSIEPDATQSFTLYVNEQPEIISSDATTFLVGTAESFTIEADGYPASTFSVDVALPDGISLSVDGVLSGTPTAPGVFTFTVTATNGIGTDASQVFTLTINQEPEITSADAATFAVGEDGSFTMTARGFPTPVLSLDGDLPDGVTFDAETGELSGTPVDGTGGVYTLTLTATNVAGTGTQTFTLTVNEAPVIVSDDAATFTVGSDSTFTVLADGHPDSTFSATGMLPAGVTLSTAGVLAGTPANGSGGVYSLSITATNGISPDAIQTFTLTINDAPEITSANATTFTVGQAGSFTVSGDGYPAVTFSVSGTLPAGVTFTDGQLSGTPADGTGGEYALTVMATNGIEPDATQAFTLTVNEAPEFTSGSATTFVSGELNTFTVTATGFPTATFSVSGLLPGGLSLSSGGVLSGTPAAGTDGTYTVTITASNGIAPDAMETFTLTIVPPEVIAPENITVPNDLNQPGATVSYPDPTTVGNVGTVSCAPLSGSFFPLGTTTVTCSSTSGLSDTFTITVLDTQRPSVSVPANINVNNATGQAGAVVTYAPPVVTDNAPGVTWSCTPPAGSFFPLGTTTVACTAIDAAGNTTKATFTVTVIPTTQYLLTELRGDTVALVTNTTAERALLATLDKVQQYVRAGNSLMAYMTMLQFVLQVERYEDARSITPTVAVQLLTQAQVLTRSLR